MRKYSNFYTTRKCSSNSYFIGANTPRGFSHNKTPYFTENELTKLFIIKGGPGTGKSTIMNRAAKESEAMGAKVTRLFCSSDPDSLDGVIIEKNDIKIAVTDGTAPHTIDPALPGCCGEIINCGDAWDPKKLENARDDIAALSAKKAIAFERAYAFISAAANIKKTIEKNTASYTDEKKLRALTSKLVKKLPKAKGENSSVYCITEAVSMKGGVRLGTFDNAAKLIGISDWGNIKNEFFKHLTSELEKCGHRQLISLSPMGDISEIYLPDAECAFISFRDDMNYIKVIHMKRFANEKVADGKTKRRFHERFFADLMYASTDALAEARKYHFQLEDIYVSAMDFEKLNNIGETLSEKIRNSLA